MWLTRNLHDDSSWWFFTRSIVITETRDLFFVLIDEIVDFHSGGVAFVFRSSYVRLISLPPPLRLADENRSHVISYGFKLVRRCVTYLKPRSVKVLYSKPIQTLCGPHNIYYDVFGLDNIASNRRSRSFTELCDRSVSRKLESSNVV